MARTVGIGHQDFEDLRLKDNFYVDKTNFIKEWWESDDVVTLIARPRRFGKTLNMSMLEKFFSVKYAGRGELFEGLSIWEDEKYREIQGTYPVIALSFARVKATSFSDARKEICQIIKELYNKSDFLLESGCMNEDEKEMFRSVSAEMENYIAGGSLRALSDYLMRYYGKKVIILLDEYDTPMQEAYISGYWDELAEFIRSLFNAAFKTNPYLERAVMTGITRVSKESIFSDLNNLEVITTTSHRYEDAFGFTEKEVFSSLDEFGMSEDKTDVKRWYDGFTFGERTDIYNPWSIINYLVKGKLAAYWANTSSNSLIGQLIREGNKDVKLSFEKLLAGESLVTEIDEQIVYNTLNEDETAIWSLLLASGYLKVVRVGEYKKNEYEDHVLEYELKITNFETRHMFGNMVRGWFRKNASAYNGFIKALLSDDIESMNAYMNRITSTVFSYFDTGKNPSGEGAERFYHGFVLGLMVELNDRYMITSNRESGFGRYDVILEPKKQIDDAIILEFKVQNKRREKELSDTVKAALQQIEEKNYVAALIGRGIERKRIRRYGFAFCGKEVLIDGQLLLYLQKEE
ncbi:hypothetical protein C818_04092 [Lachnospiraceae bacterium MD308]|nr:hypothetical protein C818_04092 [Lachnospiraceae bacterium MD308]